MLILRGDTGAQTDDEDVSEANDEGNDPDKYAQNDVGKEILKRGDSICVRLAASHVGRISAEFKALEIADSIPHVHNTNRQQKNKRVLNVEQPKIKNKLN